ncbi:putative ribonuclease H-like domain-containing protein, partial [Tanacetum coccineum]
MNKKYCLVVTDDYRIFTWVFFLATKDETSGILKRFIIEIENLVDKKVKIIRGDNGTEFKNRVMSEFCEEKGIKKEITDSKLPTTFRAKPIIAGDGPKWLFDIDVLTKLMNYVPIVAGTNSNDLVGTEESIGACHSSKETRSTQDNILMPLWKDGSLFDSSSKNASNDEPQPSSDARKKDDGCISKESGIDDQDRPKNSAQDINTAGPSINTASENVNTGNPTLEATHDDFFGDETEVDMSNISTTYLVLSTPNTRIHKDHSLDHVIGDIQYGVQTRRMTKNTNEQGFISVVYEEKTYENLHTCMFVYFLSQEEPKRVTKALRTKWVYINKKDERGIVIKNKARLVGQGYTQEESIDYDEVFSPLARIEAIRLFLAYASFMGFMVYQMDVKSAFLYGKIEEE